MTTKQQLLDLAERCEKAAGPDRKIDGEIALYNGWTFEKMKGDACRYWREPGVTHYYLRHELPFYTTSLDTARSLGGMLVFASDIGADGLPMVRLVTDTGTSPVIEYVGIAATLELAWCAAALRAKAATIEEDKS